MQGDSGPKAADTAPVAPPPPEHGASDETLDIDMLRPNLQLDVGALVDRYVIVSLLGEGATSYVYKAADTELDRQIALKVMKSQAGGRSDTCSDSQARLLNEARSLAKLEHPNVVSVYDAGAYGDGSFIAMELVAGRTLLDWCREKPRSASEILGRFRDAARGLCAAHDAGIAHGDVKPANILVGNDGRTRVVDFGLARGGNVVADGIIAGTPAYMAPEQFRGEGASPPADQFSFCSALHEALYGQRPFPYRDIARLKEAVLTGQPTAPTRYRGVPPHVRRAVARGLRRRADERHADMHALLRELERPSAGVRVRRALQVAGLAAALAGAALLVWFAVASAAERARVQQREQRAAAELVLAQQRVATLLDDDKYEDALAQQLAFVRAPEHQGTAAIAQAWLTWAARLHERGRYEPELRGLIAAYSNAGDKPSQRQALVAIGHALSKRDLFDQLQQLLALLRARHPAQDPRDEAELAALDVAAALGQGLPGAASAAWQRATAGEEQAAANGGLPPDVMRPVLEALAAETTTEILADGAWAVDLDADGRDELLTGSSVNNSMAALSTDLRTVLWRQEMESLPGGNVPARVFSLADATGPLLLGTHLAANSDENPPGIVAYRAGPQGLRALYARPGLNVYGAAVTGDQEQGRRALVAAGYWDRSVRWSATASEDAWEPAPTTVNGIKADVTNLVIADLDGSGPDELVTTLGPWRTYEVRVERYSSEAGRFELVARAPLGVAGALAAIPAQRGRPAQIAVASNARADNRPGAAAGVYLFELDANTLVERAFVPAPQLGLSGNDAWLDRLSVGDIDGDGMADLVVRACWNKDPAAADGTNLGCFHSRQGRDGLGFATLLIRRLANGEVASTTLTNLDIVAAADLDGDPAAELVGWRGDDPRVRILGAGSVSRDLQASAATAAARSPWKEEDGANQAIWHRLDDMVALGVPQDAAAAFEDLAITRSRPASAARAWKRAAQLWAEADEERRAAAAYHAAARAGDAASWRLARDLYASSGDFDQAADVSAEIVATGVGDAEDETRNRWLSSLRTRDRYSVELNGALPDDWRVDSPLGVRVDRWSGGLELETYGDSTYPSLLSRRVERTGDWVSLSVDVEVNWTEWTSGLVIELVSESDPSWTMGVELSADGGGGRYSRYFGCKVPHAKPRAIATPLGDPSENHAVTLSITAHTGTGLVSCDVESSDGTSLLHSAAKSNQKAPAGGFLLRVSGRTTGRPVIARTRVNRLELGGFRPAAPSAAESPSQRANRLLANDEVARLELEPEASGSAARPFTRLVALVRSERPDAERAIRTFFADPEQRSVRSRQLMHAARSSPHVWLRLLTRAIGPRALPLIARAWSSVVTHHRSTEEALGPLRRYWPGLRETMSGANLSATEQVAAAQLWTWRARWFIRRGRLGDATRAANEAVGLLSSTSTASPRASVLLRAAYLTVAEASAVYGERDTALDFVRRAFAVGLEPSLTLDRVLASPALANLQDADEWHALARGRRPFPAPSPPAQRPRPGLRPDVSASR